MGELLAGVFVGGASTRMGRPKGLLVHEGVTLVDRWLALFARLGVPAVLVGARAEYAHLAAPTLPDAAAGAGPLGGLVALLEAAADRDAVAVACDMPYVPDVLVGRLIERTQAPVLAARRGDRWEPFFARYRAAAVLPVARARLSRGQRDLQGLLDEAGAVELPLSAGEGILLADWDTPEDVTRHAP